MNTFYFLVISLLTVPPADAQSPVDSVKQTNSNTIRHTFADYDEEIMYFGKHDEYFTVRIFRKSGVLFRTDSYSMLPKVLYNGFRLDSMSRIIHHGPTKMMYPSGQLYLSCEYKEGALHGPFMVFYEDGAIKRREFYRNGRLSKSQCYTAEGNEQRCEAFYQAASFQGKSADLSTYLSQKMATVLDGERVRGITAALKINEIGQLVGINVSVYTDPITKQQVPAIGSYVQQVIRNMPEWVPDKLNWKPAVYDGSAVASTCILSMFRFNGSLKYNLSYRMD